MAVAENSGTISPTREDADLARRSSQALARFADRHPDVRLEVKSDGENPETAEVTLPLPAFRLLLDILNQMAQGNALTLIPVHAELTTQQAAEILNVSRPFVIKLIEESELPCKMVGTHRRVLLSDLMNYKRKVDADRLKVLEELAAQAQDLGMGY
ncbi:MAG: helix-turn-helix domain-containing protein [Planctomycetota bacterium]|nr:MAG: helix-turn-helix domain-containing protein [Planctomycetota bacterium]